MVSCNFMRIIDKIHDFKHLKDQWKHFLYNVQHTLFLFEQNTTETRVHMTHVHYFSYHVMLYEFTLLVTTTN